MSDRDPHESPPPPSPGKRTARKATGRPIPGPLKKFLEESGIPVEEFKRRAREKRGEIELAKKATPNKKKP